MAYRTAFSWVQRYGRVVSAFAVVACLALIGASSAYSQQTQPQQKAAPKSGAPAAQKGPQQPAQAQQSGAITTPNLVYTPWTKVCRKGPEAEAKTVCQIGKEGRVESGAHVVAAVVVEQEGEAKKILQLTMPQGVLLPRGTRAIIDQDEQQAVVGAFLVCANAACVAQLEINADIIGRLKKGQQLYVQAFDMTQRVMTLSLPLSDFAKAYDGKATDPNEVDARNKKLQGELQRKADETRQKLESQQSQQQPAKPQ